ncbi:hypothetical protein ATANTOWER_032542, partial [Ataeniobius toweri]|nr:hypothetical protein [Ataeniobius toweri]
PELFLLAPSSQQRRQLDNPPSQVKTLNLSTPGGSSYNNLLVFPVPVPNYFIDNKNRKTFPSECSLYVGQIYTENDSLPKKHYKKSIFKDSGAETFNQIYSFNSTLPCNTVDELVDNFHSKISDIIDSIAPIEVKVVSVEKCSTSQR